MTDKKVLDATRLKCPQPLLETKKLLSNMQTGESLQIITSDPAAELDFKAFAARTAHELIEHWQDENGHDNFVIQKGHES